MLTHSEEGTTFYTEHEMPHVPAQTHEAFGVSGAGDTVIATLVTSLGAGANIKEVVQHANHAGGIAVGKLDTAVVMHVGLFN